MGFGDVDNDDTVVHDDIVTNNNDRDKVLATVANTIFDFTNEHGNHSIFIFATGSAPSRTRLYQMGISRLWEVINKEFEVYGHINEEWHPFKRDVKYDAFLVKRK